MSNFNKNHEIQRERERVNCPIHLTFLKISKIAGLAAIFAVSLFWLFNVAEKTWAMSISDNTQAEFESGAYSYLDVQWDGTNNWLELDATGQTNGSGNYTSSIKDSGASTTWSSISWIPQRPTGKELPNNAQSETAYSSGNANMTGNMLLMHLNDNAASATVIDSSGNNRNGTFNDATGNSNTSAHSTSTAKFNTALTFDGIDDYINLGDVLDMGTSDFTISAWIKTTSSGTGIAFISKGVTIVYSMWKFSNNKIVIQINDGTNVGFSSGSISVNDGNWHHVVGVFDRDAIGEIYVDGVYDPGSDSIANAQGSLDNSGNFTVGNLSSLIDELAVYNRTLSATEIADIYKRGVLKLKFQARSCNDAACSGETFIGPSGTAADYYEWGTTNSVSTPSFNLTNIADNRYFQYKTYFETSNSSYSPELKSVSISNTSPGTYYMRADGTAADKTDATSCSAASTAMSVAVHNGETFQAGDIIVLCDDGGNFTSTIIPPSSGSSGNNINYQAETGGEPTITGATYGIRINDKQYLAFSNINISDVTQSGIRVDSTANRSGFTFDDFTITNVWQHAIWFNTTNGFTVSNVTVSDSLIQNWSRSAPNWNTTTDDISSGILSSSAIRIDYADTVSIARNTLNVSSCARTTNPKCGDAMDFINSTNVITEYNDVSTDPSSSFNSGGHGIYHTCTDTANGCSHIGNITRFNYVHQMGDDCFWNDHSQNNPLYYSNICVNTVDDCFDVRGYSSGLPANYGSGTWANNTCIDYDSSGIQSITKMSGTFKNNIFIRTKAFNCGSGEECAVALSDPAETGYPRIADSVFTNNIYYNTEGTYGEIFEAPDLDSGTSRYNCDIWTEDCGGATAMGKIGTFAQWQADNSTPDANSSIANPLLTNLTTDFTLQSTSPAIDAGTDLNLSTDYAGNYRYDMPSITNTGSAGSYTINYTDIGAYEYITPPNSTLFCSNYPSESTWYNSISSPVTMAFISPYNLLANAATTDFKYLINQTLAPTLAAMKAGTLLDDLVTFNAAGSITSDGTWYVHAIAQNENDTDEYSASYDTYTVKYDSTAPTGTVLSFGTITTSSIAVAASGTADANTGLHATPYYFDRDSGTANSGWQAGTNWEDSALSENTQYTYRVKARDAASSSNESSFVSESKYTLVDTPTNFTAAVSSQTVSLSVDTFPNDTTGSSGYYFYRTNDESSHNSGWIQTNSWQDSGVFGCNITYEWFVKYRNGDGTPTSAVSVTPSGVPKTCGGASLPAFLTTSYVTSTVSTATSTPSAIESIKARIEEILAKINDLKIQMVEIQNQTEPIGFSGFFSPLYRGMRNNDVKQLQQLFNTDVDTRLSDSGAGSPGNETDYFGPLTQKAVQKFQIKYGVVVSELDSGYGYVGPKTRAKLKEIFEK